MYEEGLCDEYLAPFSLRLGDKNGSIWGMEKGSIYQMLSNSPRMNSHSQKRICFSHEQKEGGKMNTATSTTLIGQQDGERSADQVFKTDFSTAGKEVSVPPTTMSSPASSSSTTTMASKPPSSKTPATILTTTKLPVLTTIEELMTAVVRRFKKDKKEIDRLHTIFRSVLGDDNSVIYASNAIRAYDPTMTFDDYATISNCYNSTTIKDNLAINPNAYKSKAVRAKISSFLAHQSDGVRRVEHKETADRPVGQCYANAYKEFLATGNPMAYGLIPCGAFSPHTDYLAFYIPHCFNYDPKTNTYYDTTTSTIQPEEFNKAKVVFIITQKVKEFYKHDITTERFGKAKAVDFTYGGWMFLTYDDKVYALRGKEHIWDGAISHFGTMEVVSVL